MNSKEIMIGKLNEAKEQMSQAQTPEIAGRILNRLEMLLRNCHFSKDVQNRYKEQFKNFEFDLMAGKENMPPYSLMPGYFQATFERMRADAESLINVIIEEEELCQPEEKE